MEVLITGCLLAIVLLLFYRFVERRHKLLLAKVVLGVVALTILGFGGLFLYAQRSDRIAREQRQAVTITFVPDSGMSAGRANIWFQLTDDTVNAITFRICNTSTDTLLDVSFSPKTVKFDRSTQHEVAIGTAGEYVSNEFSSDYILPPGACTPMTWRGRRFLVLDTVIASAASVDFRN